MGKTFEEWYKEANKYDYLEDRVMSYSDYSCSCQFLYEEYKKVLQEVWEASRQNMTTKDI